MSEPSRTRPAKPADPRTRERVRQAQAVETRAVAAVCAAEAKVAKVTAQRDKARAVADAWVAGASARLDAARAELAAVSGVDRAALLLGIGKTELRRSLLSVSGQGGAA